MNDESIKEIREYISCPQFGDNHYGKWGALRLDQRRKIKDLLDYITNLQQELKYQEEAEIEYNEKHTKLMKEYKRLKEENERLKETNLRINSDLKVAKQDRIEYSNELEDYKSRCEKAVEKIKKHLEDKKYLNEIYTDERMLNIVLNILNGEK